MFRRRMLPRRLARLAVGALLAACVAAIPACKNSDGQKMNAGAAAPVQRAPSVVVDTGERKVTFQVELARTGEERERGLMYRTHLAPDAGMLFLFERPSLLTFWMKNTMIPLDMIFIGADHRVVGVVADAEPQTLTARRVDDPSQYVLEIGGGLAGHLGIRAGQRVDFRDVH